ncbi:MAG: hypothetical protein MJ177_03475 [Clostridia bacterium]|nr:hypothetical protein [Clostridia bacterium]
MSTEFKTIDLLDEVAEAASSGIALPFFHRRVVKDESILALIEEIKSTLPDDMEVSRRIINDREKILDSAVKRGNKTVKEAEDKAAQTIAGADAQAAATIAQAEQQAADTVQMAQTEAARLVSESNIVKESTLEGERIIAAARAEAERIMNEAKNTCDVYASQAQAWSDDIKKGAVDYASEILRRSHELVRSTSSELSNRAYAFEQTMSNLGMEYGEQSKVTVDNFDPTPAEQ